jgi:uncharacterized protein (TIGR03085 family)
MTHYSTTEREALCDLFTEVGPGAPTLCAGWLTRDLAAHLIVRERRPDAAAGIRISALSGRTERAQAAMAAKPWAQLVDLVRSGPPLWNPTRISMLNELANVHEFFVHHEDVRRARDGWVPRELPAEQEQAYWRSLKSLGRLLFRPAPVGVVLMRPDGESVVPHRREPAVTLTGRPSELVLYAFGRTEHAQVELSGDPSAVDELISVRRNV